MGNTKPLFVKKIFQKDNHRFAILWNDGKECTYRLNDLQKQCPCAQCNDQSTGARLIDEKTLKENVTAVRIVSIGRYALRIDFTSGCSAGIYDFATLYQLGCAS